MTSCSIGIPVEGMSGINEECMVPSTQNNRGQKFAPRDASSHHHVSKRPISPSRQDGLPRKTGSAIGSFEGIIAREQSSREQQNRHHPSYAQANTTGAPRPPRVYHAAPARPKANHVVSTTV